MNTLMEFLDGDTPTLSFISKEESFKVFLDGMFHVVPKGFSQLVVPAIYMLLPGKQRLRLNIAKFRYLQIPYKKKV